MNDTAKPKEHSVTTSRQGSKKMNDTARPNEQSVTTSPQGFTTTWKSLSPHPSLVDDALTSVCVKQPAMNSRSNSSSSSDARPGARPNEQQVRTSRSNISSSSDEHHAAELKGKEADHAPSGNIDAEPCSDSNEGLGSASGPDLPSLPNRCSWLPSSLSRSSSRKRTLKSVRVESEANCLALARVSSGSSSVEPVQKHGISETCAKHMRFLHLFYTCWGIASFNKGLSAGLCKFVINLAVAGCAGLVIWDLVQQQDWLYENFAQTAFAVALLVSWMSSRGLDSVIGQSNSLLQRYAHQKGFMDDWSARGIRNIMPIVCVWMCQVAGSVMHMWYCKKVCQLTFSSDALLMYS